MSTTLFFLVPIGMLAVVWSFCFVGACFPTSGIPGGPSTPYSNTILQEQSLIAYWPLSDLPNSPPPAGAPALPMPPQGSTGLGTALDLSGNNHNGTYIAPPAYPSGTTVPQIGANPTLNLHQTSIVPGDGFVSGSKNLPFCVDFEGGYVSIPWAANSPSLSDFTFEAWIEPRWNVTGFDWIVFSARTNNNTGFVIHINQQNQWLLTVGTGTALTAINTGVSAAVNGGLTYVALTFKSETQVLSLWINPDSDTSAPPTANWPPPGTTTTYAAIDQTQPATFFIGAGDNQDAQTPRTAAGGLGAPLAPFQGKIQSVALYSTALESTDLAAHFADGASSDTDS